MKILLINNFHYRKGGSETVYFNTAEVLKTHGHDVIFFSYEDERNVECEQKAYFVKRKGTLGTLKDYFYNCEAECKLEALLEKERPDIAHVHLFWGGLSASIFRPLHKHGIPLVHTAHDYRLVCPGYTFKDGSGAACERCHKWNYYECTFHKCAKGNMAQSILMTTEMYLRQIFNEPTKNIDGFIFVSQFSRRKHIEHHACYEHANHTVLYNYTRPMLEPSLREKGDYFLFYGRLSFEKGVSTLLEVFTRHPEWKLKIVGTGPLEEELRQQYCTSKEKKCYENIQFLGYHYGRALFELVQKARFVCVPSECYENNPMTVVESYSLGTPIIGSDIGGIPEIVVQGKTGFLFKPGDVRKLEKAVTLAAEMDEAEYAKLCEGAFSFYQEHFCEEEHYKKLMDFYDTIIRYKK